MSPCCWKQKLCWEEKKKKRCLRGFSLSFFLYSLSARSRGSCVLVETIVFRVGIICCSLFSRLCFDSWGIENILNLFIYLFIFFLLKIWKFYYWKSLKAQLDYKSSTKKCNLKSCLMCPSLMFFTFVINYLFEQWLYSSNHNQSMDGNNLGISVALGFCVCANSFIHRNIVYGQNCENKRS